MQEHTKEKTKGYVVQFRCASFRSVSRTLAAVKDNKDMWLNSDALISKTIFIKQLHLQRFLDCKTVKF